MERNVIERIKNTKQNKSCLQHEACLRFKTESPNAYYDILMHMFECSQKSSEDLPAPTLTTEPYCFHLVAGRAAKFFFCSYLFYGTYFLAMLVGSVKNALLFQKFTLNLTDFGVCDSGEPIRCHSSLPACLLD